MLNLLPTVCVFLTTEPRGFKHAKLYHLGTSQTSITLFCTKYILFYNIKAWEIIYANAQQISPTAK
jgi:hypothetical protein